MKRAAAILLAAGVFIAQIPAAADVQAAVVKYGEYADYHIAAPKDVNANGVIYYPDTELMYDFDSSTVPKEAECVNSTMNSSKKYFIAMEAQNVPTSYSLKWTTKGTGSKLIFRPNGFKVSNDGYWGTGNVYNHSAAIFQESLPQDGSLRKLRYTFTASLNGKTESFSYDIELYDAGWNFFTQQIDRTTLVRGYTVDSIELEQVAGPAGELYVENVMLARGVGAVGLTEPYVGTKISGDEVERKYPVHPLTTEELESFRKLEQAILPDLSPISKLNESDMKGYADTYNSWCIELKTENGSKFANGLFPAYYLQRVPGTANADGYGGSSHPIFMRSGSLSTSFNQIAQAYNRVQDAGQKEELASYLAGLARLALTYENIPMAWYPGVGFSDGCYYGREALEKAGLLDDLYERLKRQYGLDKVLYREHKWGTESADEMKATADEFINNYKSNMIILLMAPDSPKKARDLYRFKSFMDNVLYQYSPGTTGTLKPDGTLFHHAMNKYDYGWRDAWSKGITLYPLWFKGTVFQMEPETLERIDLLSEVRYKNIDSTGAAGTPDQISTMGPAPMLKLAEVGMSDGSMDINPYRAAEWMYYGGTNATQTKKFLKMGILPAPRPRTNLTMSYASINVHRRDDWRVQTYGSNDLTAFNEYVRPAFMFYNIGGISLTTDGECPAMQNSAATSIDGRHGFDLANGYNVNRAPGVTAPDIDPLLCGQQQGFKGSSPFVGGVSTKNGNGVFTSQYDLDKAITPSGLTKAGLTDFEFKKSYFYFDDLIVCLGSDIKSTGSGNPALTTGIFQEKTSSGGTVVTSNGTVQAGSYVKSYNSTNRPWLIDNRGDAGYYLFPGQSYALTSGEQTFLYKEASADFDGKGSFISAYIKHDAARVQNGTETYAYMFIPRADAERMKRLNTSMQSAVPEIEILRQDGSLHAVRSNALRTYGYVFFDETPELNEGVVTRVTAPVTIMTKEYEGGNGLAFAVADPDLRLKNSASGYSEEKEITITLKGQWRLKDMAKYTARRTPTPSFAYTGDGNTHVTVRCKDGLTNEYLFEKIHTPLSKETERTILIDKNNSSAEINGRTRKLTYPIREQGGVTFISLSDLTEMLPMSMRSTDDGRIECYFRSKRVIFTPNSRIATVDGYVRTFESEMTEQNGKYFVPVSAIKDVFGFDKGETGGLSYTRNDAAWYEWDSTSAIPKGFALSGGTDGYVPQTGVNTITVPDDWRSGTLVFAVYKDGLLRDVRLVDLSSASADRELRYEIAADENPYSYMFKSLLLEDITSLRPALMHSLVYGNIY